MDGMNETSQTQQPVNPTPPAVNSSKSKVIPIILGIAAAIVIAIGAYVLGSKQSQVPVQNIAQVTPIPSPTPTDETVYTEATRSANWKTYSSATGKFSVRYPIEWKIATFGSIDTGTETISFGPDIAGVTEEDPNIKVWIHMQSATNSTIKSAEDYKDSLVKGYAENPDSNLFTTSVSIDTVNGFKISYIDTGISKLHYIDTGIRRFTNVIIDRDGLIYSIVLRQTEPYIEQDLQTFDQILSTFRFTDQ